MLVNQQATEWIYSSTMINTTEHLPVILSRPRCRSGSLFQSDYGRQLEYKRIYIASRCLQNSVLSIGSGGSKLETTMNYTAFQYTPPPLRLMNCVRIPYGWDKQVWSNHQAAEGWILCLKMFTVVNELQTGRHGKTDAKLCIQKIRLTESSACCSHVLLPCRFTLTIGH